LKQIIRSLINVYQKKHHNFEAGVLSYIFGTKKGMFWAFFEEKTSFFHTTVHPGSGTGISLLKKSAGIANPSSKSTNFAYLTPGGCCKH
jgi:hypothetical protein